ncbi:MAG: peptidoglycan recognition protein family protein [Armatimonadetes bacterium]|nr:peptidoglycan recognition protein family protein [Armatimonadota bacterium]
MTYVKKWTSVEAYLKDMPPAGGRQISGVVIHHTWSPDHATWRGDRSAAGIMRYWLQRSKELGYRNPLGAHYIVAPDGAVYQCFPHAQVLNANSNGHANRTTISLEIVGNLDVGNDTLKNPQKHGVLGLTGVLLCRYGLTEAHVSFHRDFTDTKSCPGTGIKKDVFVAYARTALAWARSLMGR